MLSQALQKAKLKSDSAMHKLRAILMTSLFKQSTKDTFMDLDRSFGGTWYQKEAKKVTPNALKATPEAFKGMQKSDLVKVGRELGLNNVEKLIKKALIDDIVAQTKDKLKEDGPPPFVDSSDDDETYLQELIIDSSDDGWVTD